MFRSRTRTFCTRVRARLGKYCSFDLIDSALFGTKPARAHTHTAAARVRADSWEWTEVAITAVGADGAPLPKAVGEGTSAGGEDTIARAPWARAGHAATLVATRGGDRGTCPRAARAARATERGAAGVLISGGATSSDDVTWAPLVVTWPGCGAGGEACGDATEASVDPSQLSLHAHV